MGGSLARWHLISSLLLAALVAVTATTLAFAAGERMQTRMGLLTDWEPRELRPLRDPNRIPILGSVIEVAVNILFLSWWIDGRRSRSVADAAGVQLSFTPAWQTFCRALCWLALAGVAFAALNLRRPYWTRARACIRLGLDAAGHWPGRLWPAVAAAVVAGQAVWG